MKFLFPVDSVRGKLTRMAMTTAFVAVFAAALAMLVYDLESFRRTWVDDITAQAKLVGRAAAPALSFSDGQAAADNLAMLRARPAVLESVIFDARGKPFATFSRDGRPVADFPQAPGAAGHSIADGKLSVYTPVMENGEFVGTVYISEVFPLVERAQSYAWILGAVMMVCLCLAALVAASLQGAITRPLGAITAVAREVMSRKDFGLRVNINEGGEIGTLVDALNGMLEELGHRAQALEATNRRLEDEIRVREEAEAALRVADRRKDEFLATLAHELRNPLAPIRTGLDILRMKEGDREATERARGIMDRQLGQMVRLVDDLLDVSRINTGKLNITPEPVSLRQVVGNALEIARPHIDVFDHQLDVALPEQDVTVMGDATRLAQIISNLLNNAARYTPRGGKIALAVETGRGEVAIRVSDNGIGISADMLPAIFNMFSQADTSLERTSAGLGVGLSLARHLAQLHGGTVEASSAGTGQGSTFTLRLPLSEVPGGAEPRPGGAIACDAHFRILLVDDNVDFVNSVSGLLDLLGHQTLVLHDGMKALEAAPGFQPDVAFIDIGLPGLNGYDLARALRRE
ncbi:MAG: ATP-binding protein, partial [Telluria sp.]